MSPKTVSGSIAGVLAACILLSAILSAVGCGSREHKTLTSTQQSEADMQKQKQQQHR
jgi:hypothetical protein